MNTYYEYEDKSGHSTDFFAVRDCKNFLPKNGKKIKATARLRSLAKIGAIPTYRVLENRVLGLL